MYELIFNVGQFLVFTKTIGPNLDFFIKMKDPLVLGLGSNFKK
jgi:hypothetical protein